MATDVVEISALDARPGAPVYHGPYPIRPEVLAALDERYGVGAWTHARGAENAPVRYLPVGPAYLRALAVHEGPRYNALDSKYVNARTRRFLLDLYAQGLVPQAAILKAFGLEASLRPE